MKKINILLLVDIKTVWMGFSAFYSYIKELIIKTDSSWLSQHLTINHKFLQWTAVGETYPLSKKWSLKQYNETELPKQVKETKVVTTPA